MTAQYSVLSRLCSLLELKTSLLSRAPIGNPVTDTTWLAVVGSRIKMLASNCVLEEVVEVTHFSASNASSVSDESKRILKPLAHRQSVVSGMKDLVSVTLGGRRDNK